MITNFTEDSQKPNIAVLLSSFHQQNMEKMLIYARSEAKKCNLHIASEVWVPGAMEFPFALQKLFECPKYKYKGVVILGLIEKGETAHGLVMAQSVIATLIKLQLRFSRPIGVGILGPEIKLAQIAARLEPYARNAVAALKQVLDTF